MNEYKTLDLHLAVYLLTKDVKFIRSQRDDMNDKKCCFVFEMPEKEYLDTIKKDWYGEEGDNIRSILRSVKFLKFELKKLFNR